MPYRIEARAHAVPLYILACGELGKSAVGLAPAGRMSRAGSGADRRPGRGYRMSASSKSAELRCGTNLLFNDRKLKLGTFCTNLDYGAAITTIERTLRISWPATLALAKLAEEMEFEALVPVGRWRGFGGVTNFNGAGFECFSWAAGIGASTTYPAIFATSHVPTVHPIMAAKQGAAT